MRLPDNAATNSPPATGAQVFAWSSVYGSPGAVEPCASSAAADSDSPAYGLLGASNAVAVALMREGAPAWGEVIAIPGTDDGEPVRLLYGRVQLGGVVAWFPPAEAPPVESPVVEPPEVRA